MLIKLQEFLKINSLYFESELKDILHSCCNSSIIKVLDFDKVKDEFSIIVNTGSNKLKSVDVIYFDLPKDSMYLIEMKKFDNTGILSSEDFVTNRLTTLPNKMVDSIFILLSVMGYYKIENSFYSYFLNPTKLKIKSILLSNLTDTELLPLTLANLDKLNVSISKRLDGSIVTINCNTFESTFGIHPSTVGGMINP